MNRAAAILSWLILMSCSTAQSVIESNKLSGKNIAFSREQGNCLACHAIAGGEDPGNLGPPLKNLTLRYKSKQQLREQIWDATRFNPETSMPPFGRNKILTDPEIDAVVDYLWGL